jgi:hypothetical protein
MKIPMKKTKNEIEDNLVWTKVLKGFLLHPSSELLSIA